MSMVANLQTRCAGFSMICQNEPKIFAVKHGVSEGTKVMRNMRWRQADGSAVRNTTGARKATRRQMGAPAWIRPDDGFSVRKCVISDISATGVRLFIDEQHSTIKNFSLMMSRNAATGCPCRVKWRRGAEIGAEFLTP
jgi:PilZ domain